MYSRHPDPRRVWKGGSEQHLLTPLPRAPRASSKKLYLAVFYNKFGTLARKMNLILIVIPIIRIFLVGGGVRSRYIFTGTSRR